MKSWEYWWSKKNSNDTTASVLNQLTSALLPCPPTNPSSKSDSPGKLIENQSKCYRQLGELKNLHEGGLISEDKYALQRECIMDTLKSLLEVASKFFPQSYIHNTDNNT